MKFWSPVEASPALHRHFHGLPDLEASSMAYPEEFRSTKGLVAEPPQAWHNALAIGPRNLEWLNLLNAHRKPEDKIQLSNPGSSKGIPMEDPLRYNDALLNERWMLIEKDLPPELKTVLLGTASLPTSLPVDLEVYRLWARKIDVIYSHSLRWNGMRKNIPYFRTQKIFDFRGLRFLGKIGDEKLKEELQNYKSLPVERQQQLKGWVWDVCFNATKWDPTCDTLMERALRNSTLFEMYKKYQDQAQRNYEKLFEVTNPRKDIYSSAGSLVMGFKPSENDAINLFVKNNVEAEWQWTTGGLKLNFDSKAAANIRFIPGTVAYVEDVGGDTITMDSQVSIESWDSQWTIRHEYGHVLGFPDCYIEFWDDTEKAFVSYQFDLDNLMCSRAGKFNERNKNELFKAYAAPKLLKHGAFAR
ncbi:hypothetical protein [Bdellovibrio svalbardensis]|uniref:Uncharacterized protein n=1 Tax=Bdellovibrio svalbardensis TaxID=2972972 RepID=A0ABT6DFS5_9BACT|nr:hypothetical protein [Bdellovibrio svalbardensis]MDG0815696.1 hypothetical protein [Bdellovibrio svalbardensis]